MKIHESVTLERVAKAWARGERKLSFHPGFCTSCGKLHRKVEPDAERYKCGRCHARTVYGATWLSMFADLS